MNADYYKKYEPFFGKWTIEKQLGRGSYGVVFQIRHTDPLDRTVYRSALKAITIPSSQEEKDNIINESGLGEEGASSYFRSEALAMNREITLMNKLKGHSNIVSYEDHDIFQHEDGIGWDILIRMELLTPITQYFKEHRQVPRREIIRLGIHLCRALEVCQKFNIIHRDIKPANIFVSADGSYKLGDFGVARTTGASSAASTFAGTSGYMAPEIFRCEKYTGSVDLYSLGLVLYQLLNDNRMPFYPPYPQPFNAKDVQLAQSRRISGVPLPNPANSSAPLTGIILKACAFNPADRYADPTEMRRALEAIQDSAQEDQLIWPLGNESQHTEDTGSGRGSSAADETVRTRSLFEEAEKNPGRAQKAADDETQFLFEQEAKKRREAEEAERRRKEQEAEARRRELERQEEERQRLLDEKRRAYREMQEEVERRKNEAEEAERQRLRREANQKTRRQEQGKASASARPAANTVPEENTRHNRIYAAGWAVVALLCAIFFAAFNDVYYAPIYNTLALILEDAGFLELLSCGGAVLSVLLIVLYGFGSYLLLFIRNQKNRARKNTARQTVLAVLSFLLTAGSALYFAVLLVACINYRLSA